jgi:hypothetical protein
MHKNKSPAVEENGQLAKLASLSLYDSDIQRDAGNSLLFFFISIGRTHLGPQQAVDTKEIITESTTSEQKTIA